MTTETLDQAKVQAFATKMIGDYAGATSLLLGNLGVRLGLFEELTAGGPATSDELAERTGLHERYLREWLRSLTCSNYLAYDPASRRFSLPAEHAAALVDQGQPSYAGTIFALLPAVTGLLDQVALAFQQGGGVPVAAYPQEFRNATERMTATWFDHLLLPVWLPQMPDVAAKLQAGATLADVGTGHGKALLTLARAFPASRFTGYEISEAAIRVARERATAAEVAERVRFVRADIEQGLSEQYDIVTAFDVVHDLGHPEDALRAIRRALKPDGFFVMLEIASAPALEDNIGALGAVGYAVSLLYCMTTSLAAGGEGLGTYGLPEPRVREMCAEAGFGGVRVVPVESPRNVLYEIQA